MCGCAGEGPRAGSPRFIAFRSSLVGAVGVCEPEGMNMQFKQMVGVLGSIVLTLQLGACGAANSDAGTQETGSEAVESAPASLLAVGTLYAWYTTAQFVLATTVRTDSNDKQEEAVWMACKTNEIVVGVHFNDRKLICAKLKTGWT